MMYGKPKKAMMPGMKDPGKAKPFKPCPGCPTPAKCAKAGACAMKAGPKKRM